MSMPTTYEALQSIIEWTDCDDIPSDKDAQIEYYKRRMMLIRNAARTVSQYTSVQFPDAIHRNYSN